MSEKVELKPCPFCGGKASFFSKTNFTRGTHRGWEFGIYCTKCDITLFKTNYKLEVNLDGKGNIVVIDDERKDAIEAWNRRVSDED